jgi:hypothetical protein
MTRDQAISECGRLAREARPRPPQADDPRAAMWRDVGG